MKSFASLQKINGGLKSALATLHSANDALNAKIAQFESDRTRSQAYIAENVKEARTAIVAKGRAQLAWMREAAAAVETDIEFWTSAPLLLSRIPFHSDPAIDALMRTRYAMELPAMDPTLLALTQKNALDDGNLALVWACAIAGRKAGARNLIDLSAIQIPQQAEALTLIADCDAVLASAEMLVAAMDGQSVDPVRKLELGRRMQPNRPTTHNSPGRAPV